MHPFVKKRVIPGVAYMLWRLLCQTMRSTVVGEDEALAHAKEKGVGLILVTWHGRTLIPINRYHGRGYWAMVSTSSDGDMMNNIFLRFGMKTVRGSTSARGAVKATLTLVKELRAGAVLALTADGPRGPTHVVQPGIPYLAMKSGCPVIPAGASAWPRKLWNAWDRYMIPWPFARAAFVYGEPVYVPPGCSQEELALWGEKIGDAISAMEAKAEAILGIAPEPPAEPGAGDVATNATTQTNS